MVRTLLFHLDEHVAEVVAGGLRLRGIDVTTAHMAGLRGARDGAHIAFALASGRVVITHDSDFLRLHDEGAEHAGIVYCHQRRRTPGEIVRRVTLIWEVLDAEAMRRRIEFL